MGDTVNMIRALYDPVLARYYLELDLSRPLPSSLPLSSPNDADSLVLELRPVDNEDSENSDSSTNYDNTSSSNSNSDSNDRQQFRYQANHHSVGPVSVLLRLDQSSSICVQLRVANFTTHLLTCELDPTGQLEVDLDLASALGDVRLTLELGLGLVCKAPKVRLRGRFYINAAISNLPEPEDCDPSEVCASLQSAPNIELLNDWLFCHNHSHHGHSTNGDANNNCNAKGGDHLFNQNVPEELLKPVVLDRLEQVIFLLSDCGDQTPKLLLESVADKNDSIYLQLEKSNIYLSKYNDCSSNRISHSVDGKLPNVNNTDDEVLESDSAMEVIVDLSLSNRCLVRHQIFGKCCDANQNINNNNNDNNPIASCSTSSASNSSSSFSSNDLTDSKQVSALCEGRSVHFSNDHRALKAHRMSFQVEWYRVERSLYRQLARHLMQSSDFLARMATNFDSFSSNVLGDDEGQDGDSQHNNNSNTSLSSNQTQNNLPFALLDWYNFDC